MNQIIAFGYEVERLAPNCFEVKSPEGRYLVDPGPPTCECADYLDRGEGQPCQHINLVRLLVREGIIPSQKIEK